LIGNFLSKFKKMDFFSNNNNNSNIKNYNKNKDYEVPNPPADSVSGLSWSFGNGMDILIASCWDNTCIF
jgi:hypothetical protein